MKKYLKWLVIGCCFVALLGCQKSNVSKERQESVKVLANKVIDLLNAEDYAAISDMSDAKLKEINIEQATKDAWGPALGELGAFEDYGTYSFASKDENVTVVVTSKYENKKVQFTITFNNKDELTGLYFK